MSPPKRPDPGGKPPSRIPLSELRRSTQRLPASEEEPPPLGPPPAGDGLDRLEEPRLFDETTDMEADPTRRLRKLDMAELALASGEDPTNQLHVGEAHGAPQAPEAGPAPPPPPPPRARTTRLRTSGAGDTDWPEPPELPEPPVQFAPPEMTMPPRLPDLPPPPEEEAPDPEGTSSSASRLAEAIGTPELPDMTPSDLPAALRERLRETRQTTDLRGGRHVGQHEHESTVVSQVVDMPLGAMRPSEGDEGGAGAWATEGSLPEEAEYVTSVWGPDAPPMLPRKVTTPEAPAAPPPAPGAPLRQSVPPAAEAETTLDSAVSIPKRDLVAGRYRVIERVGQGGMARIFRVQHTELGKDFALKIIHSALSEDTKVKEMFYREARLASSMDHPNIVLVTDFGVDDTYGAFIVMEHLKGESLHARLRREGKLHQNVVCEIALQVAEALHFIHGKNVVHCDIKSENVFLCDPPPEQRRRTIVKLLDFGLSRQKIPSGRVSLSEVGGTPAYMAPERINRVSPRPSMDIYSLGILMYEMLTGVLPFVGTLEEVLIAQLQQEPEPMGRRVKDPIDDRLEELVMRALRKDPEERQKDMGAFLYELRTVMDMMGIGRRRGGKAAARAASAGRVRNCELLVADCPLPLFMTDLAGNLILANQAFASFVNLTVEQTAGVPLGDTRLGRLCPEILDDLEKTLATRKPTQRILSFPWRSSKQVSMMIWLTPEIVEKQVLGVVGVVHPFSTSAAPPA